MNHIMDIDVTLTGPPQELQLLTSPAKAAQDRRE
jgi:hypothetical protein